MGRDVSFYSIVQEEMRSSFKAPFDVSSCPQMTRLVDGIGRWMDGWMDGVCVVPIPSQADTTNRRFCFDRLS